MEVTAKQSAFIDEYMIDLNGKQAAIRAGYAEKGAEVTASKLLSNPKVGAELSRRKMLRAEKTQINAAYVLHRLAEIDQMDVVDILNDDGGIKPVKDWPKIWRQYISAMDVHEIAASQGDEMATAGLIKKIKWPDKVKNLELLGKHVDVQAWKEKVESENKTTMQVVIAQEDVDL